MASILVAGSVAYDSVKTPFGQVEEALGGSATYFGLAASFFTGVRLVACVGTDFRKSDVHFLESRGIDLKGLEYLEGRTFRWSGEYGLNLNEARTLETQLNVLKEFSPVLPTSYREAPFVFLGNIDPTLQRRVMQQVENPTLIACDTMNFWIEGHFHSLLETLKRVHVLIVNDSETRQMAQEANLLKAARKILGWGPHTLVVKQGEYGALMFQQQSPGDLSVFSNPAYPLEEVLDPTGAGDTFAGGFMGYLAATERTDSETFRQAMVFGSAMASFTVGKFSVDRLRELTFTEIQLRYRNFKKMTRFEDIQELSG